MRMKELPDKPVWVRELFKTDRKFRKAIIKVMRYNHVEISTWWDRGNAYTTTRRNGLRGGVWKHRSSGMHSQMPVPVSVKGETFNQPGGAGGEMHVYRYGADEVGHVSLWNWHDDENEVV